MDYMSPLDFFKQETACTDVVVRTEAWKKVTIIAAVMGPEKTRTELLPHLVDTVGDFDQIMLAMADKLGKFLPLVGGPDYASSLIPIIEALCEVEEISVRSAVVASACSIMRQIGPNHKSQVQLFFELIKRISNEETGELFYYRVSCCQLVASLYTILSETDQVSLREIYTRLCKDELSIVRRAACSAFLSIAEVADSESNAGEFLDLLKLLVADENQTIQVLAIESVAQFAGILYKGDNTMALSADLLPLIKQYHEDPSWRIRQALAKQYSLLATVFAKDEVSEDIWPGLVHLVHDPEPEVRSIAIAEVLPFLDVVGIDRIVQELLPVAQHIVEDPVCSMRKTLAELCVDMACKNKGYEEPDKKKEVVEIISIILRIMEDEDALVRIRVIRKIPLMAEELPSLLTDLTDRLKDEFSNANSNWRMRKDLCAGMPAIVQHLGEQYFVDNFMDTFLKQLTDGVNEVREAACTAVYEICALRASIHDWFYTKIFPSLKSMSTGIFLVRLSLLTALKGLVQIPDLPEAFMKDVIDLMVTACSDPVVNIRIRAAQTINFSYLLPHVAPFRDQLEPVLLELKRDKDKDVNFFSQ